MTPRSSPCSWCAATRSWMFSPPAPHRKRPAARPWTGTPPQPCADSLMSLSEQEARRRLQSMLAAVAPDVALDAAAVHWVDAPYPGVKYGLRLGHANALLFLPVADIDGDGWPERLAERLRQGREYLEHFPPPRPRRRRQRSPPCWWRASPSGPR